MEDDPKQTVLSTKDPNSLTVQKLKSLLGACGVSLPTTKALKAEYVKLFTDLQARLLAEDSKPRSPVTIPVVHQRPVQEWKPQLKEIKPPSPNVHAEASSNVYASILAPSPNIHAPSTNVYASILAPSPNIPAEPSSDLYASILAHIYFAGTVLVWFIGVAMLVTFMRTYPKYCEPGKTQGCLPCPLHGNCVDGQLRCIDTYVPVNGKCVKDTKLEKAANQVINVLSTYLQKKNGRSMCGDEPTAWATEQELVNYLTQSSRLISGITDPIWQHAKTLISSSDSNIISHGGQKFFTNEFTLPFWCSLQYQLWNLKYYFGTLLAIIFGALYLMRWNRLRQYENELVQKLVNDCHSILMQHKDSYLQHHSAEPFVVKSHIRDFLMKPPLSKSDKQRWEKVVGIVKSDSRIQCTIWSSHGEQQDVWEWTAPLINPVH